MRIEQVRIDPKCNIEVFRKDCVKLHMSPNEVFHTRIVDHDIVEALLENVVKITIDMSDLYIESLSNSEEIYTVDGPSLQNGWTKDVRITTASGQRYIVIVTHDQEEIALMLKKILSETSELVICIGITI